MQYNITCNEVMMYIDCQVVDVSFAIGLYGDDFVPAALRVGASSQGGDIICLPGRVPCPYYTTRGDNPAAYSKGAPCGPFGRGMPRISVFFLRAGASPAPTIRGDHFVTYSPGKGIGLWYGRPHCPLARAAIKAPTPLHTTPAPTEQ